MLGFLHFRMGKLEGVIIERESERASEREREREREGEIVSAPDWSVRTRFGPQSVQVQGHIGFQWFSLYRVVSPGLTCPSRNVACYASRPRLSIPTSRRCLAVHWTGVGGPSKRAGM